MSVRTLFFLAAAAALACALAATTAGLYPAPQTDASAPVAEPSPTF